MALTYEQRDDFFRDYFASDVLELLITGDEVEGLASTVRLLRQHHVDISVATILNKLKGVEEDNEHNHQI